MIAGIVAKGVTVEEGGGGAGMDDEFAGGSLDAKWTWRQQNAATAVVSGGILTMTADPATADPTVQNIFQPLPGGPCVFRSRMASHATVNFAIVGLHLRNSSAGGLMIFGHHNNSLGRRLVVIRFLSETVYSTNAVEIPDPDSDAYQFLELELTATHVIFRTSLDGSSWTERLNETLGTFIGAGVDEVGFAVCAFGASSPSIEADYFRQMA